MGEPQNTDDKRITPEFAAQAGKGRPKGVPNKSTAMMKEAIQTVYERLQEKHGEPHGHFIAWAEGQPTEFYKLASKLLPLQLAGDSDSPLQIVINKP